MQNDWCSNKGNGWTNFSEVGSSASLIMLARSDADRAPPVSIVTPAPCAVILRKDQQDAMPEDIFPIVTKLKADAWEAALKDTGILDEFHDIPTGLQQGFYCGLENLSLSCTFIPPNHYVSQEDEDFVIAKYAEEIGLGRLSHGYEPDALFLLIGHSRTAPLAVIEQNPTKRRVIVNHLYPKNKHSIDLKNPPGWRMTSHHLAPRLGPRKNR